jgi:flagellar protein FliL
MATAKPKEPEKKDADGEEAPKKSKKLLFIIIGVLVLLIGAGAGYYFLVMKAAPESSEKAKKVEEPKDPIYVVLDPFTVNLRDGGQYLQMGLTLQMSDEKDGNRLKKYLPSVRSRVLLLLSSKSAEDLSNEEGKQALRQEVLDILEKPYAEGAEPPKIAEVLFTAFVIQ